MTSNDAKKIDHKKRIRNWCIYYFITAGINIALVLYAIENADSDILWYLLIPSLLLAIFTGLMLFFKNRLVVAVFIIYYLIFGFINMVLRSLMNGDTSEAVSTGLVIGIIGLFYCWSSAASLAKNK